MNHTKIGENISNQKMVYRLEISIKNVGSSGGLIVYGTVRTSDKDYLKDEKLYLNENKISKVSISFPAIDSRFKNNLEFQSSCESYYLSPTEYYNLKR